MDVRGREAWLLTDGPPLFVINQEKAQVEGLPHVESHLEETARRKGRVVGMLETENGHETIMQGTPVGQEIGSARELLSYPGVDAVAARELLIDEDEGYRRLHDQFDHVRVVVDCAAAITTPGWRADVEPEDPTLPQGLWHVGRGLCVPCAYQRSAELGVRRRMGRIRTGGETGSITSPWNSLIRVRTLSSRWSGMLAGASRQEEAVVGCGARIADGRSGSVRGRGE